MRSGFRVVAVSAIIVAASLMIHADSQVPSQSADIQLRLGRMLFDQGQYPEALDAYRNAVTSEDSQIVRQARAGLIQSALRVAEFVSARTEANVLLKMAPRDPDVLALYADSLWASGLFEQAEDQYREALALAPELARGRHGMARALLARSKLDEAMNEAQAPLRLSPHGTPKDSFPAPIRRKPRRTTSSFPCLA
jgi:tetratricopeptide (TPR) repeat protein